MASLEEIKNQLNQAAGHNWNCKSVSWEDVSRGVSSSGLSCWGPNISDVRLLEKNNTLLYTLRSDNWNEMIGQCSAQDIAVVVGNTDDTGELRPITLKEYLMNIGDYASYSGLNMDSVYNEALDDTVSVRFQTVFLPVSEDRSEMEFCSEVYNYQTRRDSDPKNLLLLVTPQGSSLQQDGKGAKKVFFHEYDFSSDKTHRYWLSAESSSHSVGGSQEETEEEMQKAMARGKSTAIHIGTRAMGTRFNVQMLIQIPLKQKEVRRYRGLLFLGGSSYSNEEMGCDSSDEYMGCMDFRLRGAVSCDGGGYGQSFAARVSRGSEHDIWDGLTVKNVERDPSQHITCTVTMYYTVESGIPTPEDVQAAVRDLEEMYASCRKSSRLTDANELLAEMNPEIHEKIQKKIKEQPYIPKKYKVVSEGFPC
jgi:huntingtin